MEAKEMKFPTLKALEEYEKTLKVAWDARIDSKNGVFEIKILGGKK